MQRDSDVSAGSLNRHSTPNSPEQELQEQMVVSFMQKRCLFQTLQAKCWGYCAISSFLCFFIYGFVFMVFCCFFVFFFSVVLIWSALFPDEGNPLCHRWSQQSCNSIRLTHSAEEQWIFVCIMEIQGERERERSQCRLRHVFLWRVCECAALFQICWCFQSLERTF